jgi:RNA polymerase-binding transcription factor DksA
MELTAQLLDRHAQDLRAILEAQARIADGLFGLCIDCGDDIGYERLLALPAAPRCVACQETHDAQLAHRGGTRT